MYFSCSENKGADQLRSYCEADLRLCFRISNDPVLSRRGSFIKLRKILNSPRKKVEDYRLLMID